MVPLKYKFAALAMTSALITTVLPALAQTSAEQQQQLVQGINLVRVLVEWGVLGLLILIGVFGTISSLKPPSDEEPKYPWSLLMITTLLGVMAAMTTEIIGQWTNLLKSDVLISITLSVGLLIGTFIAKKQYQQDLRDSEDWLRDEYDLKSLKIRKLGHGRKSFNGKRQELN
jgi:hypothetical protein